MSKCKVCSGENTEPFYNKYRTKSISKVKCVTCGTVRDKLNFIKDRMK